MFIFQNVVLSTAYIVMQRKNVFNNDYYFENEQSLGLFVVSASTEILILSPVWLKGEEDTCDECGAPRHEAGEFTP